MNNMNNNSNGRVDILGPIGTQFNFADKIPVKQCSTYHDALTGSWTETLLSKMFFSDTNINNLQNIIKQGVYNKSNKQFVIGDQNCDELKIIMRSVYLQNSNNLPVDIKYQVIELNNFVTKYAVEQIYNEAIGYMNYKRDASTLVVPMNIGTNTSNKGNTLELRPFF